VAEPVPLFIQPEVWVMRRLDVPPNTPGQWIDKPVNPCNTYFIHTRHSPMH